MERNEERKRGWGSKKCRTPKPEMAHRELDFGGWGGRPDCHRLGGDGARLAARSRPLKVRKRPHFCESKPQNTTDHLLLAALVLSAAMGKSSERN